MYYLYYKDFMPITSVNNDDQEVKVIQQEKGKVKNQKIELQQKK